MEIKLSSELKGHLAHMQALPIYLYVVLLFRIYVADFYFRRDSRAMLSCFLCCTVVEWWWQMHRSQSEIWHLSCSMLDLLEYPLEVTSDLTALGRWLPYERDWGVPQKSWKEPLIKRYQDPVLWAWLKIFSLLRGTSSYITHYLLSHILYFNSNRSIP